MASFTPHSDHLLSAQNVEIIVLKRVSLILQMQVDHRIQFKSSLFVHCLFQAYHQISPALYPGPVLLQYSKEVRQHQKVDIGL